MTAALDFLESHQTKKKKKCLYGPMSRDQSGVCCHHPVLEIWCFPCPQNCVIRDFATIASLESVNVLTPEVFNAVVMNNRGFM